MTERGRYMWSTLPVELKVKFGFVPDPTNKWIQSDDFGHVSVGNIDLGEWLPTRARVSMDGTRYEIGARKVDLEGLLKLAKLEKTTVRGLDHVVNFWQGNPKVKVTAEEDLVFMGVDIPPTVEGFEQEFQAVNYAYDAALTAAVEGKTYSQMLQDRKYDHLVREAEKNRDGGRTCIFTEFWDFEDQDDIQSETREEPTPITADTLRDFPLESFRTSVNFAPATVTRNGVSKEFKDAWIMAHNGGGPGLLREDDTVSIWMNESIYNKETNEHERDGVSIYLRIPPGTEVKKVEDLTKLTEAEIISHEKSDHPFNNENRVVNVGVIVEDDAVQIINEDKSLNVEVRKPVCDECKIPTWKFRWPTEEEAENEFNPYREFGLHGVNTSMGIYRKYMRDEEGEKTHCIDCANKIESDYLDAHPFASKSRAIAVARRRLDEMGYQDLEIVEHQVFGTTSPEGAKGWSFFTQIQYQREGRTVIRYTGEPVLLDNWTFEPNLKPREYIDFRYKADS